MAAANSSKQGKQGAQQGAQQGAAPQAPQQAGALPAWAQQGQAQAAAMLAQAKQAGALPRSGGKLPAWALAKSSIAQPIAAARQIALAGLLAGQPRQAILQACCAAGIAYGSASMQYASMRGMLAAQGKLPSGS